MIESILSLFGLMPLGFEWVIESVFLILLSLGLVITLMFLFRRGLR